jgi:hypothetical protein
MKFLGYPVFFPDICYCTPLTLVSGEVKTPLVGGSSFQDYIGENLPLASHTLTELRVTELLFRVVVHSTKVL